MSLSGLSKSSLSTYCCFDGFAGRGIMGFGEDVILAKGLLGEGLYDYFFNFLAGDDKMLLLGVGCVTTISGCCF